MQDMQGHFNVRSLHPSLTSNIRHILKTVPHLYVFWTSLSKFHGQKLQTLKRQAASTWDQPLSQDGQLTKHAVHCSLASRSNSLKYLTGISHFHLIVTLRDKLLPLRMIMIDSSCLLKCLPLMTTGTSGNLKSETKSSSKQELYLDT